MDQKKIEFVRLTSDIVQHVADIAAIVATGSRMYSNGEDQLLAVFARTCVDVGLLPAEAEQLDATEGGGVTDWYGDDGLPHERGCVDLARAFWGQLRADLGALTEDTPEQVWRVVEKGKPKRRTPNPTYVNALEAAVFVREGDECARWCGMAGTTPEQVRAHYAVRYPLPFRVLDALAERRTA